MDFVNDIDLETTPAWHVLDVFAKLPYFVNPTIGGPVYFDHVEGEPLRNLFTGLADVAGTGRRALKAIHGFGHNAGHRGLANPARARKKEGMGHSAPGNGVLECSCDVFLSHDLLKTLGPVFTGQYEIRHDAFRSGPVKPLTDLRAGGHSGQLA